VSLFAATFARHGSAARQHDETTIRRHDENKLISKCWLELTASRRLKYQRFPANGEARPVGPREALRRHPLESLEEAHNVVSSSRRARRVAAKRPRDSEQRPT